MNRTGDIPDRAAAGKLAAAPGRLPLAPEQPPGHLALARSVGSGEYGMALNNYASLTINVKLAGAPTDYWVLDPVADARLTSHTFFHCRVSAAKRSRSASHTTLTRGTSRSARWATRYRSLAGQSAASARSLGATSMVTSS